MRFRPCIDIHNGKVKQIIGSSLRDEGDRASENFVSAQGAAAYAARFREDHLPGGHIILLNPASSPWYAETKKQALSALAAYPNGMQVGGGIRDDNAAEFLDAGASHVIVTSYVFYDGKISCERLSRIEREIGKEHLVLDLSCSKKDGQYYIMTDRWQKYTDTPLTPELLGALSAHCDEFLIHAIDAEGKSGGINTELVRLLATLQNFPVTYAGGVRNLADIELLKEAGEGRVDFTVGSHLSIYGGDLPYEQLARTYR